MDHSTKSLKELGQIVANTTSSNIDKNHTDYYHLFFETLKKKASVQRRYNTLQHLMGYFKNHLTSQEKSEILNLLTEFKDGMINHIVLLKLFDLLAKKYKVTYLKDQYYFSPYPSKLKLLKEV